ncbi:MAG: transglycosylase domain-containing protein [Clostridia bacterium]|nr:transglycosylase domain-containing protein [Clostridia bacterium]
MAKATAKAKKKGLSKVALVIIGALITIAVTIIAVALYVFIYSYSYIHGDLKIDLKEYRYSQNQTSFVYAYNKKGEPVEVTRLFGTINRVWVDIEDTNPYIAKCYVGLEDKRFYEHDGVDWTRTIAAVVKYGGKQGGSTLTQQLIKNLTEEDEVTFVRKYKEILNALNLERFYSKEDIIEAYLNTVYLSHGCYGVKTAAETYFGKEISECNLAESAALAAITQFPSKYDPILNPDNNKERRNYCLKLMLDQDLISKKEYDEAINYKIKFQLNQKNQNDSKVVYSYYTDSVINQVEQDLMEKYGYTAKTASNKINYGGLRIYSAVDLDIQKKMDSIFNNRDYVADGSVQAAMTIMDYDGRVVGVEGGVGKKQGRRELNRATDSPRQPGSTIKPISVYGPAIDSGATYWSKTYANSASITINGQPWPKNQGGYGGGNYVTVQYGLAQSYNTISARVLSDLGISNSYDYLKDKFCLKHLDPGDEGYSPLATGSMTHGATTLEMAAAFQCYGNGGTYHQPYFYYKVEDASGNVILDKADYDNHKAVESSTAEIMNHLLQTVMTMGTGTPYNVEGQTTFGKTGTTDEDKDRWFVGGTPYYVAAVWYGYDIPREIYNVWNNPAGNLFKYVMDKVHSGLDYKEFPTADSGVTEAYYCTNSGMLASNGCPSELGYFRSEDMPGYCYGHYSESSNNSEKSEDSGSSDSGEGDETTAAAQEGGGGDEAGDESEG